MTLKVTESQFQQTIIDAAHLYGWQVAHFRPGRALVNSKETYRTAVSADGAGFPDLIMVKPPRILAVEVKSDSGKLSNEQVHWLEIFAETQAEVYIWRPSDDWEEIEKCLKEV